MIRLLKNAIAKHDIVTIGLLLEKLTVRSVLGNCKDEKFGSKYIDETDPYRVWKKELVDANIDAGISGESIVLMIPGVLDADSEGSSILSDIMSIPDKDELFQ